MPASAIATFTSASSRASSTTSSPLWSAICTAIWLYSRGGAHRLGRAVVGPVDAARLVRGALRRRNDAVAAEALHLVERRRVLGGW